MMRIDKIDDLVSGQTILDIEEVDILDEIEEKLRTGTTVSSWEWAKLDAIWAKYFG